MPVCLNSTYQNLKRNCAGRGHNKEMKKVQYLVLIGLGLKLREIAATAGILEDRTGHIRHEIWGMRRFVDAMAVFDGT